jgi:hypothetical protein
MPARTGLVLVAGAFTLSPFRTHWLGYPASPLTLRLLHHGALAFCHRRLDCNTRRL